MKGRIPVLAALLAMLGLVLPGPTSAFAQQEAATITGEVRDPSGAVVPDAEIQIRDMATGITAETKSARDGAFVFVAIQPGRQWVFRP